MLGKWPRNKVVMDTFRRSANAIIRCFLNKSAVAAGGNVFCCCVWAVSMKNCDSFERENELILEHSSNILGNIPGKAIEERERERMGLKRPKWKPAESIHSLRSPRIDMLLTLAILFLVAQQALIISFLCDPNVVCGCSSSSASVSRILGGEPALNNTWDWVVSILFNETHFCAGILISGSHHH